MANDDSKKGSRTALRLAPARKRTRRASPDHERRSSEEEANELVRRLNERLVADRVPRRVNRLRSALRSTDRISVEALGRHESWSVPFHSCFISLSHGSLRSKTTAPLKVIEHVRRRAEEVPPTVSLLDSDPFRYSGDKKRWEVRDSFELARDLANLRNVEPLDRAKVASLFARIRREGEWLDTMAKTEGRKLPLRLQTAIARDLCTVKRDAFNDEG